MTANYPSVSYLRASVKYTDMNISRAAQTTRILCYYKPMNSIHPFHHIAFFHGLDDTALVALAAASQRRHIARNAFFFQQDDPATTFYILAEGRARLSQLTLDGDQVILGFVVPGQAVGIVAAIDHAIYPLSMQAMTDCVADVWESATLQMLMERYPVLALRALRMMAGRFIQLQEQYRELATQRVERRIAHTLLRLIPQVGQPESSGVRLDLPLSRQDLAEMTGTTLYTVSRTLSQWERQGWLETARERVCIRSPNALRAIADDHHDDHHDHRSTELLACPPEPDP